MNNTYFFAKLNIGSNIFNSRFDETKTKIIPEIIKSFNVNRDDKMYQGDRESIWTISDVEQKNHNILYGRLDKTIEKSNYDYENLRKKSKTIKTKTPITSVCDFYYFIDEEYIVFKKDKQISIDSFIKYFPLLLENCGEEELRTKMGSVTVRLLTVKSAVREVILNNKIKWFHLDYNAPNDPKTQNEMENILLDSSTEKAKLSLENRNGLDTSKNGNLNKVFDNLLKIVEQGWGRVKLRTLNNKRISSDKYPETKKISSEEDALKELEQEVKRIKNEKETANGFEK